VRRLLRKRKSPSATATTQPALNGATGTADKQIGDTAQAFKKQLEERADQKRKVIADAQVKLKSQPVQTRKAEVLVGHLRETVQRDPTGAASIIREWLHD
jgi:flagellar biosynthesis/type III secretory pathway M-ring protein FliF/YscJ